MGKYIGYAILIFIVAFILNWYKIVHISFLDVNDVKQRNEVVLKQSANKIELLD